MRTAAKVAAVGGVNVWRGVCGVDCPGEEPASTGRDWRGEAPDWTVGDWCAEVRGGKRGI